MEKYILKSFIDKYGAENFNTIVQAIKSEIKTNNYSINLNDEYIIYIFEIAIFSYCDVENRNIPTVIRKMGNSYTPEIPVIQLQEIHKNSIKLIKQFLSISS